MDDKIMTVPQELLILGAAVKTGIIDALRQNTTFNALADNLSLDLRAVRVVVQALAALDYVTIQGENVVLSDEAQKIIFDPESPGYLGLAFMHRYNMIRSWVHLPEVLATGSPAQQERDTEDTRYFMAAMRHGAEKSAPILADFLLADNVHGARLLDIGGGPLNYATAFAALGAKVTVLDLPPVVQLTQEKAEKASINMVPGDFKQCLTPGPFDLAFLGNICHIVDETENRKLFKRVSNVLVSGGRIAIVDMVLGTNAFSAVFGVNMLVNTEKGGTWTLDQYTEWLHAAGFEQVELSEVAGRQVITAVKG